MVLSPALRTILARQSLLMSAMFNRMEMVEDMLIASGKPRKPPLVDIGTAEAIPERQARDLVEIPDRVSLDTSASPGTGDAGVGRTLEAGSADFGALRRRRRGVLAVLAVLLFVVVLAWMMQAPLGWGDAGSAVPRLQEAAGEPPALQKAVATTAGSGEKEVPEVSGLSLEEAVATISGAGFEVTDIRTGAGRRGPDKAVRTKPASGTTAEPGANVILTMGAGPVRTASSRPSASATASASVAAGYAN
jgi:hypothetical protein